MHTPQSLYERIVAIRRRQGMDSSEACERLAVELTGDLAGVWKDLGAYFIRNAIERPMFSRHGFDGGHIIADTHETRAPSNPPAAVTEEAEEVGHKEGGAQLDTADAPSPSPSDRTAEAIGAVLPTMRLPRSSNESHGESGHRSRAAHSTIAGTPWPLRVPWNWDAEVPLANSRKKAREVTRVDVRRAKMILVRSAESIRAKADLFEYVELAMERDDETLFELFQRSASPRLRRVLAELIGIAKPEGLLS